MLMSEDIDRVLVRRLRARDDAAFEEFFDDYYPRLFRFALARLANQDAADEAAQATMVQALRGLGQYRGEASLFTWLCAICRNEIAAVARRAGRQPTVPLQADDPEVRAVLESLVATGASLDADLARADLGRLVQTALDYLPPRYSRVLVWKYLEDLSVREIAARLYVSPKAAESLLTRARDAFREAFDALQQRPRES
jgi:RNA polymerase sigma-70 factor (ECF subfamily)